MEEVHQEEVEDKEATEIGTKSHHETRTGHVATAEVDRRQDGEEAEAHHTRVVVAVLVDRHRSEAIVEAREVEAGAAGVAADVGVAATLATAAEAGAEVPAEIVAEGADEHR